MKGVFGFRLGGIFRFRSASLLGLLLRKRLGGGRRGGRCAFFVELRFVYGFLFYYKRFFWIKY